MGLQKVCCLRHSWQRYLVASRYRFLIFPQVVFSTGTGTIHGFGVHDVSDPIQMPGGRHSDSKVTSQVASGWQQAPLGSAEQGLGSQDVPGPLQMAGYWQ